MSRTVRALGAAALLLSAIITPAAARGLASHAHKTFTVGIVLDIGGVNDKSFNHLAYTGMLNAEKAFGIKGSYIASQEETQYVPNLTHFAQLHPNLVIATGSLMSEAIYQVAKQYPNQKFAIIDGFPTPDFVKKVHLPNVANLIFREQQSGYLVGVIAGLMEKQHVGAAKHNVIGYMGGLPVPAVVRYEAGYKAGAKSVDPGIKVLGGYAQSFTDQSRANEIGRTQISQGADILFAVAGGAGLGYLAAAQQAGKYGIGVDADQHYLGKYILTSAVKHVEVSVFDVIRDLIHGKFKSGDHIFNVQNGGTGFGTTSPVVPASIVAQANKVLALMKAGKITPPTAIPQG